MTHATSGNPGKKTSDHSSTHVARVVEIDAGAPSTIRAMVRDVASGTPRLDDAMLLASEVTTNAIIHGTWVPGDDLGVTIERDAGRLRCTLSGPGTLSDLDPERSTPGGYGLMLVDRLSSSWTIEESDGVTTVQFELTW